MSLLPIAREYIQLVVYQNATVATMHLSLSMCRSHVNTCSLLEAWAMASNRLFHQLGRVTCNVHLLPQANLFPVQITNPTATPHMVLCGFSLFVFSLGEPQVSTGVLSNFDFLAF